MRPHANAERLACRFFLVIPSLFLIRCIPGWKNSFRIQQIREIRILLASGIGLGMDFAEDISPVSVIGNPFVEWDRVPRRLLDGFIGRAVAWIGTTECFPTLAPKARLHKMGLHHRQRNIPSSAGGPEYPCGSEPPFSFSSVPRTW